MFSPRMMVTWPTSTPATSVIASSGPLGSTPTFNPNSGARGRVSPTGFCAAENAHIENAQLMMRSPLIIQISYDQHRLTDATVLNRINYREQNVTLVQTGVDGLSIWF